MINGETRLKVYNRCIYDIGVVLTSGVSVNIKAGSFQPLSVMDIQYAESNSYSHFFANRNLVPVDDSGNEVPLIELGLFPNDVPNHVDTDVIAEMLKKTVKAIERWIEGIDDPIELDAIYKVSKTMDLPMSKIKILQGKMPDKDWLDRLG